MKKFSALLIAAILIISLAAVMTASAECYISGNSEVKAGGTYNYTVKVTASGIDMIGNVKCGGMFSGSSVQFKSEGSGKQNDSLSASAVITVTVSAGAQPGDTGTIYIDNASYSYYDESGSLKANDISGSKTVTAVTQISAPAAPRRRAAAPPTGWALAAVDINAMAQGGAYSIDITKNTTVPAALLAALKEKQGVLNVNLGNCTCIIKGALLGTLPKNLKGVDLGLSMNKDEALSAAAGGADVYQLHFNYSGTLPGRFFYKFKADKNSPGDTVYLYYYYDTAGVIEGRQSCVVDAEGFITVEIYHCSGYFLSNKIIDGASGIITQPLPDPTAEPVSTKEAIVNADAQVSLTIAPTECPTAAALSEPESWFGVPYAPLIAVVIAAVLLSMLLTMLFSRTGLFMKRPIKAQELQDTEKTPDDNTSDDTLYR